MSSILIGYIIGDNKSGIDSYLLSIAGMLKEAGNDIDFLTNKKTDYMSDICKKNDIGLLEIPSLKNVPKQLKATKEIFHKKHYDMAYFNISEAFHSIGAIAAKQCNIEKIIIHSHSTSVGGKSKVKKAVRKILHNIFKKLVLKRTGTDFFACSQLAAEWMFDKSILKQKKYVIINNAVDVEKFQYDSDVREKKRQELGLTNAFVIGHVSGFTPTKNVSFLIDVINEAKNIDKNIQLVLVGEGEESEIVREKIKNLHLEEYVTMLGRRGDVHELLQAYDAFVLPSFFEGAPIVAVEAQVSGLMVYLSDTITREVQLSQKCQYISLEQSPKVWAEKILGNKNYNREYTDFSKTTYCFDLNKQKEELLKLF